jgi:glycosyltransferase involved in cell wall biosynthesis
MADFLSVVIPTYNHASQLKITLKSFCHQTFKNYEVVIADDGSTDETRELINTNSWSFSVKYCYQENNGRSAARNLGWQNAHGNIIVFIDDHVVLDENFLEEHFKAHQGNNKNKFAVVRGYAPRIGAVENYIGKSFQPDNRERKWLLKHRNDPFRTFCTNNISIRKNVLQEISGFDEDFKEYGFQDAEIGWRVKLAGYRFVINLKAIGNIFSAQLGLLKRCNKMRQAGHSAVLFRKKHPLIGMQLVNVFSLAPYFYYSFNKNKALSSLFNKIRKAESKKDPKKAALENKLRYFFHSLGIYEAKYPKKELPETKDYFQKYLKNN